MILNVIDNILYFITQDELALLPGSIVLFMVAGLFMKNK